MVPSNNAIAWYVLVEYLWHIREAIKITRCPAKKSFTMKTEKNLFLYFFNYYTPGIGHLHAALSTNIALPFLFQKDQPASSFNGLTMSME
jgi:hypothetical protein